MWDLPGPGLEPVSPALAGGLPTTAPPGKPDILEFLRLDQKMSGSFLPILWNTLFGAVSHHVRNLTTQRLPSWAEDMGEARRLPRGAERQRCIKEPPVIGIIRSEASDIAWSRDSPPSPAQRAGSRAKEMIVAAFSHYLLR